MINQIGTPQDSADLRDKLYVSSTLWYYVPLKYTDFQDAFLVVTFSSLDI